jgi:hypothetical protein
MGKMSGAWALDGSSHRADAKVMALMRRMMLDSGPTS